MQRIERTHEDFVAAVRTIAVERAIELGTINADEALKLSHTKLVYGIGSAGVRGVCHYKAWANGIGQVDVVEIAAAGEESWVQLAGTTIHELGHVLGGFEAGHGKDWKASADRLGLRRAKAAGMVYSLAAFDPTIRGRIAALAADLADGSPAFASRTWLGVVGLGRSPRPCSAGVGSRGGRSRGAGSGSRLLKVVCTTEGCDYTVRVTRVHLDKGAPFCGVDDHGRMTEEVK